MHCPVKTSVLSKPFVRCSCKPCSGWSNVRTVRTCVVINKLLGLSGNSLHPRPARRKFCSRTTMSRRSRSSITSEDSLNHSARSSSSRTQTAGVSARKLSTPDMLSVEKCRRQKFAVCRSRSSEAGCTGTETEPEVGFQF